MRGRVQHWVSNSEIHPVARGAALALALVFLPGLLATLSAEAQTLSVLHSFTCGVDGQYPSAGVIRDSSGNLYDTTWYGGTYTWGTVFKLPKNGQEKVLHSFTGKADGAIPSWGVMRDSLGNLYGTTDVGGNSEVQFWGDAPRLRDRVQAGYNW